ncbi:MAG: hypothetical protein C0438_11070, partial [Pseudomonas sp.]|nr:hypothetical protein [Pseudomonas sp.]
MHTVHCGSEPARESGRSVDINIGCQSVFASRLAPTGSSGVLGPGHHHSATFDWHELALFYADVFGAWADDAVVGALFEH